MMTYSVHLLHFRILIDFRQTMDQKPKSDCIAISKEDKPNDKKALPTDVWAEVEDDFFLSIDLPQVSHDKNTAALVIPHVSIYKKPKSPVHEAWLGVLDSLGEVNTWGPMKKQYRKAFWSELHYKDRLLIAGFCYQNGDDMVRTIIFLQTLHQDGQRNTKLRHYRIIKMKQLFKYWNDETHGFERRSKYWAYDTHLRCFADLNGKPRKNQQQYVCL